MWTGGCVDMWTDAWVGGWMSRWGGVGWTGGVRWTCAVGRKGAVGWTGGRAGRADGWAGSTPTQQCTCPRSCPASPMAVWPAGQPASPSLLALPDVRCRPSRAQFLDKPNVGKLPPEDCAGQIRQLFSPSWPASCVAHLCGGPAGGSRGWPPGRRTRLTGSAGEGVLQRCHDDRVC